MYNLAMFGGIEKPHEILFQFCRRQVLLHRLLRF
jgi:hypothetical protein